MAAAVPARGSMEDRRDLDPAPPARCPATAAAAPPEPGLGRPGTARDPARRDTESAAPGAAAAGHPGHGPALAPRHRPLPLGREVQARQDRQARHPPEHQGPGAPGSPREPRLGVPPDPRRAGRPGSEISSVDGMGNPEQGRDGPCAAADCAHLAAVPALPGRGDPGVRLLHRGTAPWHAGLCPGRDRARHQARPHPRSHFASDRGVHRPAGPKPDHGPGRAGAPGQVHDPRSGSGLHRCVRRGPGRCRDPDRTLQRADAPDERDSRALDRGMPTRAPGPNPHLEPGPSAPDPVPVRNPP